MLYSMETIDIFIHMYLKFPGQTANLLVILLSFLVP